MSSARNRTFERMGIVLRRSTTRCTWPRDFNKAARSRVTFMGVVQSGFCSIHHARPLAAPGTEADFGAAFAKSQAAAINPPPLLHGHAWTLRCAARPLPALNPPDLS